MIRRDYRIRVHDPGTTTPSDGTVDFVLDHLTETPTFGAVVVRPTEGRSDLGKWTFRVLDHAAILTANQADPASGRADLIGRVAELQVSADGATWNTDVTGRWTGSAIAADNPEVYTVTIEAERWLEQNARVFTQADTAWLWPAGLRYNWAGFLASGRVGEGKALGTSGARTRLQVSSDWPLSTAVVEWIRRDVSDEAVEDRSDGSGNFTHLRARIDGTDYEVLTFGGLEGTRYTEALQEIDPKRRTTFRIWIAGTLGAPANGSHYEVRLWAPTAPPSEVLPLHLGTWSLSGDSAHKFGKPNPWDLVEAILTETGERFDSSALSALQASTDYPRMAWRITDPNLTAAAFLEEQVYAPLGVVPFLDNLGRVAPRPVHLPAAEDFDPDTAFVFDADNVAEPPAWGHSATEVVNQITVETRAYREVGLAAGAADGQIGAPARPNVPDFAADFLEEIPGTYGPVDYDTGTTGVGIRPRTFKVHGAPQGGLQLEIPGFPGLGSIIARLVEETFHRFGDGPQWGAIRSLRTPQDGSGRTPETRQAGELVILDLDSWPNLATGARGGQRVVQLMSREPAEDGIRWEVLDAGPKLQPLVTPTVSVALNGASPHHAVDVTVSGVPAGATATVELGLGASGPFPRKLTSLGNGTHTVGRLPSATLVRVRGRSFAPGRIRSASSTVDTVTTSTLAAPTSLSATVDGALVLLTWTPAAAAAEHALMPVYRVTGSGTWLDALERPLPPGSGAYTFGPLTLSTGYDLGIRHVDAYGGLGTVASTTASTGSTARTLAAPTRPQVVQGRVGATADLPPEALTIGYGIHVRFRPAEIHARTVAEVATDSGFSTIEQTVEVSPGVEDVLLFTDGLDDTLRYARLRHERAGYTASVESAVVTSKPTALLPVPGGDRFPGGFAEVFERDGGKLEVFIQAGGDPDTDSASYAWAKNPSPEAYPTVDDTSRSLSPLPARENLNQDDGDPPTEETFADGDLVLIRVRFANAVTGFGQEFLLRHVYGQGSVVLTLDRVRIYNPYSGTFPINQTNVECTVRVPSSVRSWAWSLTAEDWNVGGGTWDAPATTSGNVNQAPTAGLVTDTRTGFNPRDRIVSLDLTFYDAVGGDAGAGSVIGSLRLLEDVLVEELGGALVAIFDTSGSGATVSSNAIRLGDDGKGDGVLQAGAGAIVKLRDVHDAGNVATTWQPDYLDGAAQIASMTGDTQLLVPANWATARPMNLRIATNGHALTFESTRFYADGGTLPTLSGVVFLSIVQMATNYVVIAALKSLGPV